MTAVRLSADAKVKLRKMIDRKVADVAAKAATVAYNTAISYQVKWSGTYRASWQVVHGLEVAEHLKHPSNKSGKPDVVYSAPSKRSVLPDYNNPYQMIRVTNTARHAMTVEYDGTPYHAAGWMIAFSSKQSTLHALKLF